MAAKNRIETLAPGVWVKLTDGAPAGGVTLQNQSSSTIRVAASVAAPTDPDIATLDIEAGRGHVNMTIPEMFPGAADGAALFGWAAHGGRVSVSHAA
jgi:hypothetical protein